MPTRQDIAAIQQGLQQFGRFRQQRQVGKEREDQEKRIEEAQKALKEYRSETLRLKEEQFKTKQEGKKAERETKSRETLAKLTPEQRARFELSEVEPGGTIGFDQFGQREEQRELLATEEGLRRRKTAAQAGHLEKLAKGKEIDPLSRAAGTIKHETPEGTITEPLGAFRQREAVAGAKTNIERDLPIWNAAQKLPPKDKEAALWALANREDPRSAQILEKLGIGEEPGFLQRAGKFISGLGQ